MCSVNAAKAERARVGGLKVEPGPYKRDIWKVRGSGEAFMDMPVPAAAVSRRLRAELEQSAIQEGINLEGTKLSGHVGRRYGTARARELMEAGVSGVSVEAIDRHFRWRERALARTMQVHYAGLRGLLERLRVTLHF